MVLEYFAAGRPDGDHDHTGAIPLPSLDKERTNTSGVYQLEHVDTYQTTYEQPMEGALYQNGQLVLQPAASRDPCDPMNLTLGRKILGVFCLSFFGALAASAEIILGSMLPVFALEYAGLDPKILKTIADKGGFPLGANALSYLEHLGNGPSIEDIYLLASLPVLMIGLANLFLIPVAIAIGRRPVVLITGVIAIVGAVWAGNSQSLGSHLGARAVQAVGAGTVESLIPFIIQDIVHIHQRNTWISAAFAAQGVIIIAIGFSAPVVIINMSWRWVYFITAIAAAFFLLGTFFFLPETRWKRTRAEMNGVPRDDAHVHYEPRTFKYNIALFHGEREWHKGLSAFTDTLRTFFYPQIFFITMLNSMMIAVAFAASYTTAPALLTQPWSWPFLNLGLCLVPVLIAAICVALVTGGLADHLSNLVARKRGVRQPENQLINLILPTLCGLIGSILFGLAGNDQQAYPWPVFLLALGMVAFGFLGANSIGVVYALECYPHLAGPSLVNIASFRCIFAFLLTFYVSDWVVSLGYLKSFMIYTGLIAVFMCFIPIIYIFGPAWRKRWPAANMGDHKTH